MRIVVCVKHVPDLQSRRGFGPDRRVVRDAEDGTLNEVDENAVEAALQLVADAGGERSDHEVVALTLGPAVAADALRRALQMGADRAVHLLDDAFAGSDYIGTATALAAGVRHVAASGDVGVVLTGMAALDGLGSVVPSLLAAELGWPQLTVAAQVEASDGALQVRRELDGVTETLRAPMPTVVGVTDLANTPRFPKFKDIMAARSKEIEELDAAALGVDPGVVGAAGARTRVLRAEPTPPRPAPELVTDDAAGSGGRALAEYLIRNDLI